MYERLCSVVSFDIVSTAILLKKKFYADLLKNFEFCRFLVNSTYVIVRILKSAQINMIFSYKNYINKRYLKPLL